LGAEEEAFNILPEISLNHSVLAIAATRITDLLTSGAEIFTPLLHKKDGEKPNRSWIAPLVYSCNPTWICYRFNAHNI
jgi:hypothetical protein